MSGFVWDGVPQPRLGFAMENREAYKQYLIDNKPIFDLKKWENGSRTIAVRFCVASLCRETKSDLRNKNLPDSVGGDQLVFLEIRNNASHITVSDRIKYGNLSYLYTIVDYKRNHLNESSENLLDVVTENCCRLLGLSDKSPAKQGFLSSEDGMIKYESQTEDGKEEIKINPWALVNAPSFTEVDLNILETFTFDPEKPEDGKSEMPGASTTVSYQHFDKKGELNPHPWRIRIKNYTICFSNKTSGGNTTRKNEKIAEIRLTDKQYKEICDFIELEWEKDAVYDHELAFLESI